MPVELTINVTGRPKRDIIEMAREFAGLAGYEFDATPEEVASHLRRLDVMMAVWPFNMLGYDAATYGSGLPEDPSGLPEDAIEAVANNLALRIAPGLGASLSIEARSALALSTNYVTSKYGGGPPTMPLAQSTVRGAGHPHRVPFISEIVED